MPEEPAEEKKPTEAEKLAVIDQNPDLEDPRLYSPLQEPDRPSRNSRRAEEPQAPVSGQARLEEPTPAQPAQDESGETEDPQDEPAG
ncbi:MAG: hypothetical protein ACOC58_03665 [Chloroflexota bacterium]